MIDPSVPPAGRALLAANPGVLTPATHPTPQRPRRPGAAAALRPAAWLLVPPLLLAVGLALRLPPVVFGAAVLFAFLIGTTGGAPPARRAPESPAAAAARRYHGRYFVAADFDASARALLVRAQDAIDTVTDAGPPDTGDIDAIDAIDNEVVLPRQLWDIATTLRHLTDLRDRARAADPARLGVDVGDLLAERRAALAAAEGAATARVEALERYAAHVTAAEEHRRRLRELRLLLDEQQEYRDLLAATAADEYAVGHIDELAARARAAEAHLGRALEAAVEEARTFAPFEDDTDTDTAGGTDGAVEGEPPR
ncbi:hypothetical protein [Nocardiopsis trehalosi]|uniref:hypothetical protein n=1 Tax=Nocardiopsis trehalosi TaxID=109329 RepID=UPI001C3F4B04|nr:hypothetical protein [Nocardiopsis trehalosi]